MDFIAQMDQLLADAAAKSQTPVKWHMEEADWLSIVKLRNDNFVGEPSKPAEPVIPIYRGIPVEFGSNFGNGGVGLITSG